MRTSEKIASLEQQVARLERLAADCQEQIAALRRALDASDRNREDAVRFSDILDEYLNGAKEGGE